MILTVCALQGQLQAKVPAWVEDPVVAGGRHVKHQPSFLRGPDDSRVQQEQVWLPGPGEQVFYAQLKQKGQVKNSGATENTEQGNGVKRGSQRSVTEWNKKRDEARKQMSEDEGSRWWGPGEHFIFLIDNNVFINRQSIHTLHTVRHWLEFCAWAKKVNDISKNKKQKNLA